MDIIASYKKYTGKMKDKNKKTKIDYKKQGKRNKAMGADFERRTRKDLEEKGWKVSKYQNNVEFFESEWSKDWDEKPFIKGKSVPAKASRYRLSSTGFPDFIAYKLRFNNDIISGYEIQFVECKTNGYLSKEEKEKARWYLDNKYCNKFFIAYKTKEKNRVKVNYKELK